MAPGAGLVLTGMQRGDGPKIGYGVLARSRFDIRLVVIGIRRASNALRNNTPDAKGPSERAVGRVGRHWFGTVKREIGELDLFLRPVWGWELATPIL